MVEIRKLTIKIKGMHCVSCENIIREALLSVRGIKNAKVNYVTEKCTVDFDPIETDIKNIMEAIKNVGYEPVKIEDREEPKGFFKRLFWR